MLAAVLWLGHISFIVIDNENHVEAVEDEGLFNVSKLIGCGMDELKLALSTRKMRVGNDNIVQKLTLTQAIDTRDALAKSIYVVAGLAADGRQIVGRTKSEANYESLHDSTPALVDLASKCAEYVRKLEPEVDPSPACYVVVKKVTVTCVCKLVSKEIEDLIDMEVGFVARSCDNKVALGTKCGSEFTLLF
ncbi:hypothetical protein ACE6H2_015397 [Prunus campanulata]